MPNKEEPISELILSHSPHIRDVQSVKKIMWLAVLALMPSNIFAIYLYGFKAIILLIISVMSAVASEAVFRFLIKKPVSIADGSAVITGLLVAMIIPPEAPIWMPALGSAFAVVVVKQLFGGLGLNIFNPALAAKGLLTVLWPVDMTAKWMYFTPGVLNEKLPCKIFETVAHDSPLSILKNIPEIMTGFGGSLNQLYNFLFSKTMVESFFIGNIGGCIGETSAFLILIGGLFLLYKKIINWHIPAAFIGTVAVFMLFYYYAAGFAYPVEAVIFHLFSGGLFLGAFFMATDMVTTPVTKKGMIIFGFGCGFFTSIIRLWGEYSEGAYFAVLLMNAAVPLIDRYTRPRVFGT